MTDKLPFASTLNYQIIGLEEHQDLNNYLNDILKDYTPKEISSDDEDEIRRIEDYQERNLKAQLIKALKAKGYYDAKIKYQDHDEKNSGKYNVVLGDAYKISNIRINPDDLNQHLSDLKIKKGQIIDAAEVLKAQENLLNNIQKNKCYFKADISHQVILDKTLKTANIIFKATISEEVTFGQVTFTGQEDTKESYLKKLIPFKEGDCYRAEKIATFRERLMATGLFSKANINIPETAPADNIVPIPVVLKERASRTIRAGLSYYTDEGIGIVLGWVHRNFFGAAEQLEAQLKLSQLQQKLSLDLTKPFFLRKDQNLSLEASLERQNTDAYDDLNIGSSASISRTFNKRLTGSTGVALKLSRIKDNSTNIEDTYGLISFPNALTFDNRDDKLDPHKGWNIRGSLEPFIDAFGVSDPFIKGVFSTSTYFGFTKDVVFATRASVASLWGADLDNIPATERLYSGGGGSIRGYGYQEVGPKINGDPSGGASLTEGSAELRFKITDTIGAATFIDAGNVDEDTIPQFNNLSVGAGIGLRYYTSFGPLRFDVATPLTNKEDTDQNYQIYISIGQAF